jgi:hypothetical protein
MTVKKYILSASLCSGVLFYGLCITLNASEPVKGSRLVACAIMLGGVAFVATWCALNAICEMKKGG